jgi:hypothetical protein
MPLLMQTLGKLGKNRGVKWFLAQGEENDLGHEGEENDLGHEASLVLL